MCVEKQKSKEFSGNSVDWGSLYCDGKGGFVACVFDPLESAVSELYEGVSEKNPGWILGEDLPSPGSDVFAYFMEYRKLCAMIHEHEHVPYVTCNGKDDGAPLPLGSNPQMKDPKKGNGERAASLRDKECYDDGAMSCYDFFEDPVDQNACAAMFTIAWYLADWKVK